MSVLAFRETQFTAGPGWTADVSATGAMIHVSTVGDPLPEAVEALVAPIRRRFLTVEWVSEDDRGWDVYEMTFNSAGSHLVLV